MAVGYVLIRVAPAREHDVFTKLSKILEIVELHPLFGEYDLITKIEVEDFEKLGSIVVNKIRTIKGVIDTETLTGTKFFNFGSLFISPIWELVFKRKRYYQSIVLKGNTWLEKRKRSDKNDILVKE